MYPRSQTLLYVALLASSTVQAHMVMASPIPYGADTLTNAPLAADGSDFPCKLRSDTYSYSEKTLQANTFHVGDSPLLSFKGSATHGGGSCQVSLTTDLQPTKDSQWMVIHSIEGGCPANVTGNLKGGADTPDPTQFHFTIPDIAEGRYSLAWTWLNRIGNREFYMNCAPVLILPKTGSRTRANKTLSKRECFPEMFVANINGCMTPEGFDVRYPNPGDSVEYDGAPANLLPSNSPACTGGAGITATGTVDAATPTLTGTAVYTSRSPSGDSSGGAPTTATGAAPTAPVPAIQSSVEPVSSILVPNSQLMNTPLATPTPGASSSTRTNSTFSGSCSTEGEWNCIRGASFQRCASGMWSSVIPLAPGTECTSGQSSDLNVTGNKRHIVGLGYMHRRRRLLLGYI